MRTRTFLFSTFVFSTIASAVVFADPTPKTVAGIVCAEKERPNIVYRFYQYPESYVEVIAHPTKGSQVFEAEYGFGPTWDQYTYRVRINGLKTKFIIPNASNGEGILVVKNGNKIVLSCTFYGSSNQ